MDLLDISFDSPSARRHNKSSGTEADGTLGRGKRIVIIREVMNGLMFVLESPRAVTFQTMDT
jgi:hypothetical protein